jgi:hypothetical protein
MELDKVKERIRLLLNVANNSGSTDGEIDNALRFAKQMMLAYHLEEQDLKDSDPHTKAAQLEFEQSKTFSLGKRDSSWESRLCGFVSHFFGSVGVYIENYQTEQKTKHGTIAFDQNGNPKMAKAIVFYGPKDECLLAKEMYEQLAITIAGMARLRYGGFLRGKGRDYGDGYVSGLMNSLHEQEYKLRNDSSSTGMIVHRGNQLALRKKEAAQEWLADTQGIHLAKAQKRKIGSSSGAYSSGRKDGENTNLGMFGRKKRLN